jgi:hypothetical protein
MLHRLGLLWASLGPSLGHDNQGLVRVVAAWVGHGQATLDLGFGRAHTNRSIWFRCYSFRRRCKGGRVISSLYGGPNFVLTAKELTEVLEGKKILDDAYIGKY